MTIHELIIATVIPLLVAALIGTVCLWRRTIRERDGALDAADVIVAQSERAMKLIDDQRSIAEAEKNAALKRAALAETRERIAHAAWGRAVDKLLTPAPVTVGRFDATAGYERRLQAVPRG